MRRKKNRRNDEKRTETESQDIAARGLEKKHRRGYDFLFIAVADANWRRRGDLFLSGKCGHLCGLVFRDLFSLPGSFCRYRVVFSSSFSRPGPVSIWREALFLSSVVWKSRAGSRDFLRFCLFSSLSEKPLHLFASEALFVHAGGFSRGDGYGSPCRVFSRFRLPVDGGFLALWVSFAFNGVPFPFSGGIFLLLPASVFSCRLPYFFR